MRCDRFRDAASARLDGEPIGMSPAVLDEHLAGCPDCAVWVEDATRVTRQLRLSAVGVPDLTETIMGDVVLPTRRVLRRRLLLRAALLLVALVQLGIAVPALSGAGVGMAMSEHAAHEGAAWNLAIGIAFLAAVLAPRRAAGLVPLLGTFIVVLAVLSVHDIAAGTVTLDRMLTHIAALLGLILLISLDRTERALPPRRAVDLGEPDAESKSGKPPRKLRGVA